MDNNLNAITAKKLSICKSRQLEIQNEYNLRGNQGFFDGTNADTKNIIPKEENNKPSQYN